MHPLEGLARRLDRSARHHKRQAQMHRSRARELRQKQAKVEARLAELGIKVTYDGTGEGKGDSHGRYHRERAAEA